MNFKDMENKEMMVDVATNDISTDEKQQTTPCDIKAVDVSQLPDAGAVKDGDMLLLVRPNGDGTQQAMRVSGSSIAVSKKKKQQIVIGRAIRPQACEIGGVENWYVYGVPYVSSYCLLCVAPMDSRVFLYDKVILNIKLSGAGREVVFEKDVQDVDRLTRAFRFVYYSNNDADDLLAPDFYGNISFANAFRVDSYSLANRVLTLCLTHKRVSTADLRGTSTHHYFKDGVRRYHVSKSKLKSMLHFDSNVYGPYDSILDADDDVGVKKEIRHKVISDPSTNHKKGYGIVTKYSLVRPKAVFQGKPSKYRPLCQISSPSKKRRPYGKYKIWARNPFNKRKSDEYIHCRMKCVGIGNRKENVEKGPRFDTYRVTIREI